MIDNSADSGDFIECCWEEYDLFSVFLGVFG